jgi:hypothetical protein
MLEPSIGSGGGDDTRRCAGSGRSARVAAGIDRPLLDDLERDDGGDCMSLRRFTRWSRPPSASGF